MSFNNLWGLLGLLAIPILILIYFLKQKYVEKPVSSTFIWKKSLKYVKTKIPINVIISLLLILQILVVLVASFALSDPVIKAFSSKETIIVIDSSASMMAENDEGKTRFELAVAQAKEDANSAGENSKITVIAAGDKAKFVIERSSEKHEIVNALEKITCDYGVADFDGAKELVKNIQKLNKEVKVKYYTDKTYEEVTGFEYIDFSKENDMNLAITKVKEGTFRNDYTFNVDITNYGQEEVKNVKLTATIVSEGQEYVFTTPEESLINIPAGESKTIQVLPNISSLEAGTGLKIDSFETYTSAKFEIKVEDAILEDNIRSIYSTEKKPLKILYVSEHVEYLEDQQDENGNPIVNEKKFTILLTVLRGMGYTINPKTDIYKSINDVNNIEGYDLYIFEGKGTMPEVLPTDGAVWFINPDGDIVGTDIKVIVDEDGQDEMADRYPIQQFPSTGSSAFEKITTNVPTAGLYLGRYRVMAFPGHYERLYSAGGQAVIATGIEEANNTRVMIFAFDIYNSNLPVNFIAFPILVNNLVQYSVPEAAETNEYVINDILEFNAPVGATNVELRDPNDVPVYSTENATFEYTLDEVGVYSVYVSYQDETKNEVIRIPVSIALEESDINSQGFAEVVQSPDITAALDRRDLQIWPYFLAALLLLLLAEWGVYYKDEF